MIEILCQRPQLIPGAHLHPAGVLPVRHRPGGAGELPDGVRNHRSAGHRRQRARAYGNQHHPVVNGQIRIPPQKRLVRFLEQVHIKGFLFQLQPLNRLQIPAPSPLQPGDHVADAFLSHIPRGETGRLLPVLP